VTGVFNMAVVSVALPPHADERRRVSEDIVFQVRLNSKH
jgi:hypothetical protein